MSTIKADNITWKSGESSGQPAYTVTADKVILGTTKSWLNYNGVTGPTVNKSYNISSVTKSATGKYQIYFAASFIDAYYSFSGSSTAETETGGSAGVRFLTPGSTYHSYVGRTVSDIKTIVAYDSANITDGTNLNASFIR
jgi:hypothetical protein